MSGLNFVIMAAGLGTRMKSSKPKVLHKLGGVPMLERLLQTVQQLQPQCIAVVTGYGADQVQAAMPKADNIHYALQTPQLGTGHAVKQALPLLPDSEGITLILNGDGPLIEASTLQALVKESAGNKLALLTVKLANPHGYGRIIRSPENQVVGIVEEKDATDPQRQIQEVNTGVMAVPTAKLRAWINSLKNENAQQEYYLTDIIAMAVADGVEVCGVVTADEVQVAGVNSPAQLAALERAYQKRLAEKLMEAGVRLADPVRIDIRGELLCERDVEIDVNCVFEGKVSLGEGVTIGAHCVLRNAVVAAGTKIEAFTHMDGQEQGISVGENARIGPFSRLRPGATLAADVHVGNFVEVKNATLAKGAKANHLSYIGDATIGEKSNIGAGTITANYDGVNKYHTTIGAEVRVGSSTVLVAPVTLGDKSGTAAGSAITEDVPAGGLGLGRARQLNKAKWNRPEKS